MMKKAVVLFVSALFMASCGTDPVTQVKTEAPIEVQDPSKLKPFALSKIAAKIRRGSTVGVYQIDIFCSIDWPITWRSNGPMNFSLEGLDEAFVQELKNNNYPVISEADNLFDSKAEMLVGAKIFEINSVICFEALPHYRGRGSIKIGVEWQLYQTRTNAVVSKITTYGSSKIESITEKVDFELLFNSFSHATNNLMAHPEFLSALERTSLVLPENIEH